MPRTRGRAALAAIGALAIVGASPRPRATYRMHGTIHFAGAALAHDVELRADAVVEPGAGPGDVVLHLAAMGQRCRVVARCDAAGAVTVGSGRPAVVLGHPVPGTGSSTIPIRGEARATAEGRRDHSRAAER